MAVARNQAPGTSARGGFASGERNRTLGAGNRRGDGFQVPGSWFQAGGRERAVIPLRRVRDDALPENINYVDTGCDIWHRCLTCPLPRCRYDQPGGARFLLNEVRDRRIAELKRERALPVDELARRYRLSRRSVFRILRKAAAGAAPADLRAS